MITDSTWNPYADKGAWRGKIVKDIANLRVGGTMATMGVAND